MSGTLDKKSGEQPGGDAPGGLGRYATFRAKVRSNNGMDVGYRIAVAVVGGIVLAGGIVMIPYPGPGWLVVFAGLAILGSEFTWAKRLLHYARERYDAWNAWLWRQRLVVRLAVLGGTGLVVLTTLWLLDIFGTVVGWVGIDWAWLQSPIGSFF